MNHGPPTSLTRAQFLEVVRQTDTIPALYPNPKDLYGKEGLRAVVCEALPIEGVEVWVWKDGLCFVAPELFKLLLQAKEMM